MADEMNNEVHKKKKAKSKKRKEEHNEEKDPLADEAGSPKRKRENEAQDSSSPHKQQETCVVPESTTPKEKVWSSELDHKLLDAVDTSLSSVANKKAAKLIFPRSIDWNAVSKVFQEAPEEMSAKDIQKRWTTLSAKVRKLRTAEEVLADVRSMYEKRIPASNETRKTPISKRNVYLPKKPITSFFLFMNEKRSRLHEKYPELSNPDLARKLGKKWNELPEEKKQKYIQRHKHELEQYNEDLLKYLAERFPDEKPPPTAFELWKVNEEKHLKKERPDISEKKLSKKLKREWENLEESRKSSHEKRASHLFSAFQKRLLDGHQ